MVNLVRDGKKIWPTCEECGCRLQKSPSESNVPLILNHFGSDPHQDARGCRCKNLWLGWLVMGETYITLTAYNRV